MVSGPIFVVGSSRSGTTMMGRVLGGSPDVFTFRELHFFEEMWSPEDDEAIDAERALRLVATLMSIERDGYLSKWRPDAYLDEAREAVSRMDEPRSAVAAFRAFLFHEASRAGKRLPCDQTPRNLFYAKEILEQLEGSRFLYMVRDPRDVLLSQKNRWKRRLHGSGTHRVRDMVRDWCNYHPWTITRLWRGAEDVAVGLAAEPRFLRIRFEDLLARPAETVSHICKVLGIGYSDAMLQVPVKGSSNQMDQTGALGIDPSRAAQWRNGGLNSTEIWICEKVAGKSAMERNGQHPSGARPNPLLLLGYALWLPAHLGLAVVMNFHRVANLRQAVSRRLGRGVSGR